MFCFFFFPWKSWGDHQVLEQEERSQKPVPNKKHCVKIFLQDKGSRRFLSCETALHILSSPYPRHKGCLALQGCENPFVVSQGEVGGPVPHTSRHAGGCSWACKACAPRLFALSGFVAQLGGAQRWSRCGQLGRSRS